MYRVGFCRTPKIFHVHFMFSRNFTAARLCFSALRQLDESIYFILLLNRKKVLPLKTKELLSEMELDQFELKVNLLALKFV